MAVQRRVYDQARIANEPSLVHKSGAYGEVYFETSHAGLVVDLLSQYLGDGESAYYAVVYNPGASAFEDVWYASDRDGFFGGSAIDAPPALLAAWAAEKAQRAAALAHERELAQLALEHQRAEIYARTPRAGSIVRVVKGRKIKIGSEGRVFWVGVSSWGPRVGVELSDGAREFIAQENLEVLEQPGP